jgi:hypothetical protein
VADRVDEVLSALARWGAERDWLGADPYEGLNTPLARLARTPKLRQAVIQAYRRAPVDPPPPLRARPRRNAKTAALVLSGYVAAPDLPDRERQIAAGVYHLNQLRRGGGWGYHFDFQSRWGSYGGDVPNAIATCFAVDALLDADEPELALRARRYLGHDLWSAEGGYFGYHGAGAVLIHNASALVCGALARLHEIDPDDELAERVLAAAATTAAGQRPDGSWPYGESPALGWVDNFHTAYTLEGLHHVAGVFGAGDEVVERGYGYWTRELFDDQDRARARGDRTYPLEAHSYATAIDTLVVLRERFADALPRAERVAEAAIRDLWLPDRGHFAFERRPRFTNKRAFVRWTNAPMFRALSRLSAARVPATPAR